MTINLVPALTYLFAGLGLACFLWPAIQRMRGNMPDEPTVNRSPMDLRSSMQSPLWWAGLVLTAAALFLQRQAG